MPTPRAVVVDPSHTDRLTLQQGGIGSIARRLLAREFAGKAVLHVS